MPQDYPNRVQEVTASIGTGALVLGGASPRMSSLSSAGYGNGARFWGLIEHATLVEVEIARCAISAGSITRGTPLFSSLGGAAINFSAGTKTISLVVPAHAEKWTVRDDDFVPLQDGLYDVDTTGDEVTATLPADPAEGDRFTFSDFAGTWGTNTFYVDPNGEEFEDLGDGSDPEEPMTCSDAATFTVVFADGKYRIR